MTVKETRQALGNWEIVFRSDTPRALIDEIELNKFGHIAVIPGRIDPKQYGDGMLTNARYVGVYRSTFRQPDDTITIKGAGMAMWLGDEDGKGDVLEAAVILSGQSFPNSIRALLPPSGSITEGTIFSIPGAGTYSGRHQWQTPREAITYVTDTFSSESTIVEFRVNNNGTLDAGSISDLYEVSNPKAILVKRDAGRDMRLAGLRSQLSMDYDVEDLTTRVVLLAQGEGDTIPTAAADLSVHPGFTDIHGNPIVATRLVSESETSTDNAPARAQMQLRRWSQARQAIQISTDEFDVKGDFVVGDYIYVYAPNEGFYDLDNQVIWRGQPVSPIALRCIEMTWPIRANWTVAFRKNDGTWLDLSQYYKPETGTTQIAVGDYRRTLAGNNYEPLGFRPNLPAPGADATIPDVPTFTGFSVGAYQSTTTIYTKSAIRAQWAEPLNTDGSTITDGDHYELRYRANAVIGYSVDWDTLEDYSWDDLGTWDGLISEPVSADPQWNTAFVGWDTNSYTVLELTPGVQYEFQIRAVDAATPPNRGAWSSSTFVNATGDPFPPSTPAVPVVAGSLIAIQVIHELGKASGGTYNLEPDMDHLNVHVGENSLFLADDTNKVGELIANGGMVLSGIPAIGTFQVENTSSVWVKVVAVDQSGNRSSSSAAVQATIQLIDNAHISDLSVSKLTAGTITADTILAASMEIGVGGDITLTEGMVRVEESGFLNPPIELGKTTGGSYGLRVQDLFGVTKCFVGQLDPSGGTGTDNYGIALVNAGGDLVKLEDFIFGPQMVRQDAIGTISISGGFGDLSDGIGPYVLGVPIGDLGRAVVTLTSYVEAPPGSAGLMGVEVLAYPSNDTIIEADALDSLYVGGGQISSPSIAVEGRSSVEVFIEGLDPGEYTFVARYATLSGTATFANRTIKVQPY